MNRFEFTLNYGKKILAKIQKDIEEKEKVKNILLNNTKKSQLNKNVPQEPLINVIEKYRSQFIRSENNFLLKTKSKDRAKQIKQLVRHVFNKYPVPDFLSEVWVENNDNNIRKQFDFKQWYICVAKGGSLYKEITKEYLTKKETHIFLNCAHKINIEQSIVYAIAKAEGAIEGNALRIARSKINKENVNEYWRENIRWFSQNTPNSINEINDIVDYLNAKKIESPHFSLSGAGLTLNALVKKMHDWHYDLRRLKAIGEAYWEGHAINDTTYTYVDQHKIQYAWYFHQIKSAKQLQQEGNAQRHCVLSYKNKCINGSCSIWSLKWGFSDSTLGETKRKLTIEVTNSGSIVQARGLANRQMKSDEKAIVQRWAKENNLQLSNWI